MSEVSLGAAEPAPRGRRVLAGWRVYLTTLAMLPLAAWLSAMIIATSVAVVIGWRMAKGELAGADFSLHAQLFLNQLVASGVVGMVVGVASNSAVFGAFALILSSRVERRPGVVWDAERAESRRRSRARLSLRPARPADHVLAVVGLLGLTVLLDALIVLAGLGDTGSLAQMRQVVAALSVPERLLLAVVVAFGAGIAEELYFRGYMMAAVGALHRPWTTLAVTSVAFGAFHLDALHSPVAGLMGLFLGFVVLTTGSIWPAISAHVANNLSALLLATAEPTPGALAAVLAPAGLVAAALAAWGLRRRHPGEPRLPPW